MWHPSAEKKRPCPDIEQRRDGNAVPPLLGNRLLCHVAIEESHDLPRVQSLFGLKVVALVPLVMPSLAAQATASA